MVAITNQWLRFLGAGVTDIGHYSGTARPASLSRPLHCQTLHSTGVTLKLCLSSPNCNVGNSKGQTVLSAMDEVEAVAAGVH